MLSNEDTESEEDRPKTPMELALLAIDEKMDLVFRYTSTLGPEAGGDVIRDLIKANKMLTALLAKVFKDVAVQEPKKKKTEPKS